MSRIKAVKWFAIYVLLTLVFAAATWLASFLFRTFLQPVGKTEFDTLFFFFLFLTGIGLVAVGVLVILQVPKLTFPFEGHVRRSPPLPEGFGVPNAEAYRYSKFRTKRKWGIMLILIGLTFIVISLTQF